MTHLKKSLKSVVDGAFVDWTSESVTHYLVPDENAKNALVDLFHNTGVLRN